MKVGSDEFPALKAKEPLLTPDSVALPADLLAKAKARVFPLGRMFLRRLSVLSAAVRDPWSRVEAFDVKYAAEPDFYGYATEPSERERFALALDLLEFAGQGKPFGRVFEIACGEGIFTEMLAPRCESLLAVDFSGIALARARERLAAFPSVGFQRWNMRKDPVPNTFDLFVVMDVLSYLRRPARLRNVIDKLVSSMRSGDLMLAGDFRQRPELRSLETSLMGRALKFGGKWVIASLCARPELETLKTASTDTHIFAVLRKC